MHIMKLRFKIDQKCSRLELKAPLPGDMLNN